MSHIDTSELQLLDTEDMSTLLSISKATLWRWIKEGLVPAPVYFGKSPRWHKMTIVKMLADKLAGTTKKRNLDEFL